MVSMGCNSGQAHAGAQVPLLIPHPPAPFAWHAVLWLVSELPAPRLLQQGSATAGWLSPRLALVGRRFLSCRTSVCVLPGMRPCCALSAMAARSCRIGRTLKVERGTHQGLQRPRSLQGCGEGCPSGRGCADAGVECAGQRPAAQHGAASQEVMSGEQGDDIWWCKLRRLIQKQ